MEDQDSAATGAPVTTKQSFLIERLLAVADQLDVLRHLSQAQELRFIASDLLAAPRAQETTP